MEVIEDFMETIKKPKKPRTKAKVKVKVKAEPTKIPAPPVPYIPEPISFDEVMPMTDKEFIALFEKY